MTPNTPSAEEVSHAYKCAEAGSGKAIKVLARHARALEARLEEERKRNDACHYEHERDARLSAERNDQLNVAESRIVELTKDRDEWSQQSVKHMFGLHASEAQVSTLTEQLKVALANTWKKELDDSLRAQGVLAEQLKAAEDTISELREAKDNYANGYKEQLALAKLRGEELKAAREELAAKDTSWRKAIRPPSATGEKQL